MVLEGLRGLEVAEFKFLAEPAKGAADVLDSHGIGGALPVVHEEGGEGEELARTLRRGHVSRVAEADPREVDGRGLPTRGEDGRTEEGGAGEGTLSPGA